MANDQKGQQSGQEQTEQDEQTNMDIGQESSTDQDQGKGFQEEEDEEGEV